MCSMTRICNPKKLVDDSRTPAGPTRDVLIAKLVAVEHQFLPTSRRDERLQTKPKIFQREAKHYSIDLWNGPRVGFTICDLARQQRYLDWKFHGAIELGDTQIDMRPTPQWAKLENAPEHDWPVVYCATCRPRNMDWSMRAKYIVIVFTVELILTTIPPMGWK